MLDGNISVEEDTELRDLVMQTLENNGVLAKVRAELRASVFLALEEQESVMNPMPLLNKTVKQYLASSEGKLLFSLVREFLEYFGLSYTISVYDPETYFGKEYNYAGRNKLCEKLGINSTEPLLGEILKNTINGAFNNSRKNDISNSRMEKTLESSTHFTNTTFDVSVPTILNKDDINDVELSDTLKSTSDVDRHLPINVTITEKKQPEQMLLNMSMDTSTCNSQSTSLRELKTKKDSQASVNYEVEDKEGKHNENHPVSSKNKITNAETDTNVSSELNKTVSLIKFDDSVVEPQANKKDDVSKPKITRNVELQMTNNRNCFGKTMFFDEIIVEGKKEKVESVHKSEPLFSELPPIMSKNNSIFSNLPPLNGKKEANINDLKELMDATDGIDNFEEDYSSASGSTNEQSPSKEPDKSAIPKLFHIKHDDRPTNVQNDEIGEEIEELLSSTSCLDTVATEKKNIKVLYGLNK